MNLYYSTFSTPFGPFSVAVDELDAVVATAFGNLAALQTRLSPRSAVRLQRDERRTARVREAVRAYAAGTGWSFDVDIRPHGTPFQQRVWANLRRIPVGETRSYGELARELDSGARAVGRANATNPICLIVPCHRVVGADGKLTGFAFGEPLKRRLLEHESRALAR